MNINLRPWKLSDIEDLVENANNSNVAQFLTNAFPHPYTRENAESFIKMTLEQNPIQIMAIVFEEKIVGSIGLHKQADIMMKNMELGYFVGEAFWGKGIATEAVKKMTEYGFKNFDIVRIFARPFGSNIPSQKVLEKAGYKLEARIEKNIYKNNEFLDELIYAFRN